MGVPEINRNLMLNKLLLRARHSFKVIQSSDNKYFRAQICPFGLFSKIESKVNSCIYKSDKYCEMLLSMFHNAHNKEMHNNMCLYMVQDFKVIELSTCLL